MNVLVDTSVWSLALRKNKPLATQDIKIIELLTELIHENRAQIIGPIRQELLSGVPTAQNFEKLKEALAAFHDLEVLSDDYVRAAQMFNQCRKKGIQGSHLDFLICSVAEKHHMSIFTLDKDFKEYSKHISLMLYHT